MSIPLTIAAEFLEGIQDRNRIFPPWSSPAYSNAAFRILGYVGEKIANISFDQVLQRYTLEPLNLVNTYTDKPNDDGGIIPSHDSLWPLVHGDDLP